MRPEMYKAYCNCHNENDLYHENVVVYTVLLVKYTIYTVSMTAIMVKNDK